MLFAVWDCMHPNCPRISCISTSSQTIKSGSFFRKSDSKTIQRFKCKACRKSFSRATSNPCFGQNKRRINATLEVFFCSGVSQRRAARILKIHRTTVARKLQFLANQARMKNEQFLLGYAKNKIAQVQFDDLETFEHTKCKPLSVTLAVETETRKFLGFEVSRMPAKGLLAKISVEKYGIRADERKKGLHDLFDALKKTVHSKALFESDKNPHYVKLMKAHFPDCTHKAFLGRDSCIVGQGELKKIGYDPLFSLNHTCAMLRANINRLFRKTWCTTKKPEALVWHLTLYMKYHNEVLTAQR